MTAPAAMTRPAKVLLATDLGPRCDRALDRAAQLAKDWEAELDIIHVIEEPLPAEQKVFDQLHWRHPQDPVGRMRRRISEDLAQDIEHTEAVQVHVATGNPADRIVEAAKREGCDLIVTGVARDEPLGRAFIGTTVNQLVRRSSVPLLVVRARARRPYSSILVATDFSGRSGAALMTALALFPDADFTAFHSLDLPHPPFAGEEFEQNFGSMKREEFAKFLASTLIEPSKREGIPLVVKRGDPEQTIPAFVQSHSVDLTVIGSHGRSALFDALIGSTTSRLLECVEGDMLIVAGQEAG